MKIIETNTEITLWDKKNHEEVRILEWFFGRPSQLESKYIDENVFLEIRKCSD